MKIHKSLRPTIKAAEARGWTVKLTRKNHLKLTRPGHAPVFASTTPSDYRGTKNLTTHLRESERNARKQKVAHNA